MEKHLTNDQISTLITENIQDHEEWIAHIHSCKKCKTAYESELEIHKGLKQLEYDRPSMRFARNVLDLIVKRKEADKSYLYWIRFTSRAIITAISLALIMLTYMFIGIYDMISIDQTQLNTIKQWSLIVLLTSTAFWLLYFFDGWLGKRQVQ